MKRPSTPAIVFGAVVAALVVGAIALSTRGSTPTTLDLGTFEARVRDGEVATATLHDSSSTVTGTLADGTEFVAPYPEQ
ncbi:MAG: hypothetical protein R2699_07920 [Acidimicrobiales bacterium]